MRGLGIALVAALFLASCGGSDGDDATKVTEESTTTTTTPAEATPLVVAHRGASAYAPEHTLAAYELALSQGADYIEQDLQLTADGHLVDVHDDTLDRTAQGPAEDCTGPVSDKTLDQLQRCDVGRWFNEANPDIAQEAFVGLRIPTMDEIVGHFGKTARYYIETKLPDSSGKVERQLVDLLTKAGLIGEEAEAGQVIFQSFIPDSLQRLHELAPDVPVVLLLVGGAEVTDDQLADIAEYADGIGPSKDDVDEAYVTKAHDHCLVVHPYTVDDPAEMTSLLDAGVDGMFTNRPDELAKATKGRTAPARTCDPAAA